MSFTSKKPVVGCQEVIFLIINFHFMSFIRRSGKPLLEYWTNAISTVYYAQSLLYSAEDGTVLPADATSGNHVGIAQEPIPATDARYTTAGKICVDRIDENDIFEALCTGTLTAAMIGTFRDLSDSVTVNAAAQSKKVVLCVGFISATKGLFKINARAGNYYVATT